MFRFFNNLFDKLKNRNKPDQFQDWLQGEDYYSLGTKLYIWIGRVKTTSMMYLPALHATLWIGIVVGGVLIFLFEELIDSYIPTAIKILLVPIFLAITLPLAIAGGAIIACVLLQELAMRIVSLPIALVTYPFRRAIQHFFARTALRNFNQLASLSVWFNSEQNNAWSSARELKQKIEEQAMPEPSRWWPLRLAEAFAYRLSWPFTMLAMPLGAWFLVEVGTDLNLGHDNMRSPNEGLNNLFTFLAVPLFEDNYQKFFEESEGPHKVVLRTLFMPIAMALCTAAAAIALPAAIAGFMIGVVTWPLQLLSEKVQRRYKDRDLKTRHADLSVAPLAQPTAPGADKEQTHQHIQQRTNEVLSVLNPNLGDAILNNTNKTGSANSDNSFGKPSFELSVSSKNSHASDDNADSVEQKNLTPPTSRKRR